MTSKSFSKVLLWGMVVFSFGCRSELLQGLDEEEANEIVVRLFESGIDSSKVCSGTGHGATYAVTVPRDQVADAIKSLSAVGLPRARHDGFKAVYKDRALVPGRFEQQALFVSALQEELAKTLESVQGVLWSRVHVTLQPQVISLGLKKSRPVQVQSASVLLGYVKKGGSRPPLTQEQVQRLVANAVQGLQQDSVAVVFSPVDHPDASSLGARTHGADAGILRWVLVGLAVIAFGVAVWTMLRKFTRRFWIKGESV